MSWSLINRKVQNVFKHKSQLETYLLVNSNVFFSSLYNEKMNLVLLLLSSVKNLFELFCCCIFKILPVSSQDQKTSAAQTRSLLLVIPAY